MRGFSDFTDLARVLQLALELGDSLGVFYVFPSCVRWRKPAMNPPHI